MTIFTASMNKNIMFVGLPCNPCRPGNVAQYINPSEVGTVREILLTSDFLNLQGPPQAIRTQGTLALSKTGVIAGTYASLANVVLDDKGRVHSATDGGGGGVTRSGNTADSEVAVWVGTNMDIIRATPVTISAGGDVVAATVQATVSLQLKETGAGTNVITMEAPSSISAYTITLPPANGSLNQVLTADGTSSWLWRDLFSRTDTVPIICDFYNITSPFFPGLTGAATSSGTVQQRAGEPNHPGILALRDSTTANGGYRIQTAVNAILISGNEEYTLVFQMTGVKLGITSYMGFFDNTTITAPVDCVCMILTTDGVTGTIIGRGRANNVATDTATSFSPTLNTWYTGLVQINSDATLGTFSIFDEAGALQWTDSVNNIPTAVGRETGIGVSAYQNSVDAASDLIYVDFLMFRRLTSLVR